MPAISAATNPIQAVIAPANLPAERGSVLKNGSDQTFATALAKQKEMGRAQESGKVHTGGQSQGQAQTNRLAEPERPGDRQDTTAAQDTTTTTSASNVVVLSTQPAPEDLTGDADTSVTVGTDPINAAVIALLNAQPTGQASSGPAADALAASNIKQTISTGLPGVAPGTSEELAVGDFAAQLANDAEPLTAAELADSRAMPAKLAVADILTADRSLSSGKLQQALPEMMVPAPGSSAATLSPTAATPGSATGQVAQYAMTSSVGSNAWNTDLGHQVLFMSSAGRDRAELVLTPPNMGRIEVSISIKGDEANAIFVAANPAVRDALENALPRLREVLADAGITLGQTHIGAQSQDQSAANEQRGDNTAGALATRTAMGTDEQGPHQSSTLLARAASRAMVDIYA